MNTKILSLAAAWLAIVCASSTQAAVADRYAAEHDGVRIEITTPRADVVRVRLGKPDLANDGSWAVLEPARSRRSPMEVSETAETTRIETPALRITLDRRTLAVTVADREGHVLLADAPTAAASFAGGGFRLRKAMPGGWHYFGLGDKAGSLDRRGGSYVLWNTDAFGYGVASDPLYKSVPFVIGLNDQGTSFGLFVDDTWRSVFDFGKTERDVLAISAEGGPVDYYVMAGSGPKDVVEAYGWLTGTPPLTPLWALGFQQSHWSYMTQVEVQGIADRLRHDRIPADVVWMDIDYQDRNRPFTVNKATFPDLPGLVKSLGQEGIRLVVITDLHVADAPKQGYAPYDSGQAADLFLKTPSGGTYVGPVWPGDAVFPDFSRPKARAWWGGQYADFVHMGVAGFWNDMNEPAIFNVPGKTMPLDVVHRIDGDDFAARTAPHAELHNVYGQLNSRATYEGLLRLQPDQRPFVLTRASYAGGQRYAATWTGDNVSSWQHLKMGVQQLVSLGLSGFAYAGNDVGGYAGEQPSAELLTRWFQVGAFMPLFRSHAETQRAGQEPWVGDAAQVDIRRRYIAERYRLMPYLYATAEQNSRTGIPLLRPVFLNFPEVLARGDRLGGTDDQFMVGDDLLVAPSPTPESPGDYGVDLPGEGWYDYWTGEPVAGRRLTVTPSLDRLPVYVRPGAIVPRQPLVQSTAFTLAGRLELHVYPGPGCHGEIYADDGQSLAYRRGAHLRQRIHCEVTRAGLRLGFDEREGEWRPWWSGISVVVHGWTGRAPQVRGSVAADAALDRSQHAAVILLPDMPRGWIDINREPGQAPDLPTEGH